MSQEFSLTESQLLERLSADATRELRALETLDDAALWDEMVSKMPGEFVQELDGLLWQNQAGTLDAAQSARMMQMLNDADRLALRKARAAVLLRYRGRKIPNLTELGKL